MNNKLYKSIITDISKTVKKHINENLMNDLYDIDQETDQEIDLADNVYENNTNVFHMEVLTDSFIFYIGLNKKFDYDNVKKLLEPFVNLSEEQLCKLLTLLLKILISKELNDMADITVVNVEEFDNIKDYDEMGMMRLEIKDLDESDYAKFYKIMKNLDGRDDCYIGDFWFNGYLEPTDDLRFVKWVYDNTYQENWDNNNKRDTFNDFLTWDYIKK